MRKFQVPVAAVLACVMFATVAQAADEKKAATDPAMAEMMAASQPGKPHEMLKSMAGTFKATVKMWQGPGEPQVSEGTMVNTLVLGGRYLEGRFDGKMGDTPFHGVSVMGYDNRKKEYWSTWYDDMSTSLTLNTGAAGEDGKSLVLTGSGEGPDGSPMKLTCTTRLVDANTHVFTMSGPMGGQETTMMEITYTRKK